MFNACIALRDPIPGDLRDGNLRSEGRWERFALEACMENPEIEEVYTLGYDWPEGRSLYPKYKGLLGPVTPSNCVLLLQDWNAAIHLIGKYQFTAVVVHVFHGPWLDQIEQIEEKRTIVNGNLFFCMGHPEMYLRELGDTDGEHKEWLQENKAGIEMPEHLGNFTTSEKFFFLPLPWIPKSYYEDRFHNKNILWCNRIQFLSDLQTSPSVRWALDKMLKDNTLQLRVLTGWPLAAARDHDFIKNETIYLNDIGEDMNGYFWKHKDIQPYSSLKDRVQLCYEVDYANMLVEQSQAKVLIGEKISYGGPPLEAAMHGVPFVQSGGSPQICQHGALAGCPDYLSTPTDEEGCALLDRLLVDHDFYTKIAKSYNTYAVNTYSYAAFNNSLNRFLVSRKVI